MFSGGLLSSNLTRSLGKIRNRQKSQSKKQTDKESRARSFKKNEKQQTEFNLNWDEYDTRIKNSPNTKPTYTLEVKGRIQLASYAGCLLLLGLAILLMSSLVTHLFKKNVFGPIGIGVGIYAIMMAICWLLDNRDRSKKFFHIQDLYTKYATKKYEKHDKGVQVDRSQQSNHSPASSNYAHIRTLDEDDDDDSRNPCSLATNTAEEEADETFPFIDREPNVKEDIPVVETETTAEKNENLSKGRIHPELIKRFSMQQLSYDITFQSTPSLKVTDC